MVNRRIIVLFSLAFTCFTRDFYFISDNKSSYSVISFSNTVTWTYDSTEPTYLATDEMNIKINFNPSKPGEDNPKYYSSLEQITVNSKTLFIILPIDAEDTLPPVAKIDLYGCSSPEQCGSKKTINIKYKCDCTNVKCPTGTLYGTTEEVSVNTGKNVDSCAFISRRFRYGTNNLNSMSSINEYDMVAIKFSTTLTPQKYVWNIEYTPYENSVFSAFPSSSLPSMCLHSPISTDYIVDSSSSVSVGTGVYLAKPEYDFTITAPSVPSGCSMSSKTVLSFGSYSCSTEGTSDGKKKCVVPTTQTANAKITRTIFGSTEYHPSTIIDQTFYFVNFYCEISKKEYDYDNGVGTYTFRVGTHTGPKNDAIASETFSATNCNPVSEDIQEEENAQRFIKLQFAHTVTKTSITLKLEKGTFKASESFSHDINVCKNVAPVFSSTQNPAMVWGSVKAILQIRVNNCCPGARVYVNFGSKSQAEDTTFCSDEKKASFDLSETPASQKYTVCAEIGSSKQCSPEKTFEMSYIDIDSTSSETAIAGYALSPRRQLSISFFHSVSITSVTANVGPINQRLTENSPGHYSEIVTMETGGPNSVKYTVSIAGDSYIFNGADFTCEYPSLPEIIPSKINYGLTEVNLNFFVKWNTPAGEHVVEYLKYECPDIAPIKHEKLEYKPAVNEQYLQDISTIKTSDFINWGNDVHRRCTWSADVFNGFDHGIVSGVFHLGIDTCAQDKFNPISEFEFARSTCSGSFDSAFIFLARGKAHASWKRADTEQCETETDGMRVAFGTEDSSIQTFPISSSYELSFPSSVTNSYSIWITQLKGQDQSEPYQDTRAYCFVGENDYPSNPTIEGSNLLVNGQTFYFKEFNNLSAKFTFNFPDFCDYDNYFRFTSKVVQGSVNQDSSSRTLTFEGSNIFNHFIVESSSYTYCGFGTQTTYSKGISGYQFTNCMNGFENFGQDLYATYNCYSEYGCVVTLNNPLRLKSSNCNLNIAYKISEKPYISDGNYFLLAYSITKVENVDLSYNLPEQTPRTVNLKVDKYCTLVVKGPIDYSCSLTTGAVFTDRITLRKETDLNNLRLSWKDGSEISPGCSSSPIYKINNVEKDSPYYEVTSLEMNMETLSITVHTYYYAKDYYTNLLRTISDSSTFTKPICISEMPEIESIKCENCEESPSGVYNLYVPYLMLSINIKKPGKSCIKENEYLQMQFIANSSVLGEQSLYYSKNYMLEDAFNVKLNTKISSTISLKLADYIITAPSINLCVVANFTGAPTLKSPKTQYLELTGKTIDVTIEINALKDFFSPCKNAKAKYKIVGSRAYSTMKFEEEIEADASSSYTFKFTFEHVGTYIYQIIAQDVLEREYVSDYYTINVCTNAENAPIPVQFEPIEDEIDVPVFTPTFSWEEFEPDSVALKCSSMHIAYIIVELEEADIFSETNTYSIKSSEISLTAKSITLPKELLLKLNTKYFWRLAVGSGTQSEPKTTPSEKPFAFITVQKDCHYMECHQGYCDEESLSCVCTSDYRGEFCDRVKGLTATEIGIIVGAIVVALIVILIIIFIILKRAQIFRMKMPDFTPYKFLMPKCIDSENALSERDVIRHIEEDPDHDYEWAVNILNCTPLTEADNICRAFVYAFEKNGLALDFLLHLVESEVDKAEQPSLLFRSNSISTKFFKSYSRLVGLPYLFRVLAPLLSKLLKDEKKAQDGVALQGSSANAYINSKDAASILVESYELNPSLLSDSEFETTVESNSLSIQLTCQMFLSSLDRTTSYCPFEFKRLCARIKKHVSMKFPDHKFELGLSSFIFLRYFVACLTVPETFGIVEKSPSPNLRRQFILISKVLSNLSTNVKFGDKEDYMVIMNDFLESRKNALDSYYELLCSDDPTKIIETVPIPDKFYNGSIEVIGVAAAKVSAHEWVPESSITEPRSIQVY